MAVEIFLRIGVQLTQKTMGISSEIRAQEKREDWEQMNGKRKFSCYGRLAGMLACAGIVCVSLTGCSGFHLSDLNFTQSAADDGQLSGKSSGEENDRQGSGADGSAVSGSTGSTAQNAGAEAEAVQNAGFSQRLALTDADLGTVTLSPEKAVDLSSVNGTLSITDPGAYTLTGTLQGSIVIDAQDQAVQLILDNASVKAMTECAVDVVSASKVIITSRDDTQNSLEDGSYTDESADENACVFSTAPLSFNGGGQLTIKGDYKDGVHSKDTVKVCGANLEIQAKRDGIRGNDGVGIRNANLTITAKKSAVKSSKSGKKGKGNIALSNSTLKAAAGEYGIYSSADLYLKDVSTDISAKIGEMEAVGTIYQ